MQTQNTENPAATSAVCPVSASAANGTVDLTYSEHPLALTDFGFSVTNASVTCPCATYSYSAIVNFNYVDPGQPENATLDLLSPVTYGPTITSNCTGPSS